MYPLYYFHIITPIELRKEVVGRLFHDTTHRLNSKKKLSVLLIGFPSLPLSISAGIGSGLSYLPLLYNLIVRSSLFNPHAQIVVATRQATATHSLFSFLLPTRDKIPIWRTAIPAFYLLFLLIFRPFF